MSDPTPVFRELSGTHTFLLEPRASLGVRKVRLAVVEGPDQGVRVESEADHIAIGGHADARLALTDRAVSRFHAAIRRTEHGYQLADTGSTNGTFLDGNRIESAYLSPGSRITVGRTTIAFDAVLERVEIDAHRAGELGAMIGRSLPMQQLFGLLKKLAPMEITVLVTGETGTGKELAARALHEGSARASGPFVVVDCGAVQPGLVESLLFGHEKGAFTGAVAAHKGAFEAANGGTIFLDEVGELPLELQPKLLRALQQRQVCRVGSTSYLDVDVRVVAATHRDLEVEVRNRRFREDLFYRLAVVTAKIPPLRDRRDDIPWIVGKLLAESGRKTFTAEAMNRLLAHAWPGNVRELVNVVQGSAAVSRGALITEEELPPSVRRETRAGPSLEVDVSVPLKDARERLLADFERTYLLALLQECRGNVSEAARRSGVHRKTVERLARKHGLERGHDGQHGERID
jgi:DNA-binding NtrC family response regulator